LDWTIPISIAASTGHDRDARIVVIVIHSDHWLLVEVARKGDRPHAAP